MIKRFIGRLRESYPMFKGLKVKQESITGSAAQGRKCTYLYIMTRID